MGFLVELIREYGFGIVFLNVFVEQLGAPIPAYPVLVVTGALEGADWVRLLWLVAVAVSAALIADLFWYQAGKAYGHRVLGRICRISLSPDACIRQTETVYGRWGARSLLVAKFVPGFASIASALAGVMGTPLRSFVLAAFIALVALPLTAPLGRALVNPDWAGTIAAAVASFLLIYFGIRIFGSILSKRAQAHPQLGGIDRILGVFVGAAIWGAFRHEKLTQAGVR